MAAEAILSAFVKTVLGNLNSLLLQEFGSAWGVKEELGKLESTLSTIHAVLQDAEEQQVKNEAVKNWLKKLKDATNVADDLIDEFAIEAFWQKVRTRSLFMKRMIVSLFMQRAFGHGRKEPPNLIMHAKEIVKKCGGIPLAAKALGGLMRFKTDERDWLFVKESEIRNLPEEENGILPALKLSYYHLPPHLKMILVGGQTFGLPRNLLTHFMCLRC